MTAAERTVCEALVADGMYCIDRGIDDAHAYMAPIANALLRGDLGDAAMASLGRELAQQFLRDIRGGRSQSARRRRGQNWMKHWPTFDCRVGLGWFLRQQPNPRH
jgi:hypothetical protein